MTNKKSPIKVIAKKLSKSGLFSKRPVLTEKDLKAMESKIGAKIFGPVKPNERREFFNDNEKSWFFHQEITDSNSKIHSVTLHYEVNPQGVLRISSNPNVKNEFISGQELDNFVQAAKMYHELVMTQIYNQAPSSNKKPQ